MAIPTARTSTSAPGLSRVVLSDWDAAAQPPRLELLRLSISDPAGATLRTSAGITAGA